MQIILFISVRRNSIQWNWRDTNIKQQFFAKNRIISFAEFRIT